MYVYYLLILDRIWQGVGPGGWGNDLQMTYIAWSDSVSVAAPSLPAAVRADPYGY